MPSCSLRNVGTAESLRSNNIVLLDVKCKNVTSVSENCQVGSSELLFECIKGHRFANYQGIYIF